MESQGLDERIEWEARRVAAAFGVKTFTHIRHNATITDFFAHWRELALWWTLDSRSEVSTWRLFDIKGKGQSCQVSLLDPLGGAAEEEEWGLWSCAGLNDIMARWLYRLGFEDEGVLAELNCQLSMHEKMELRLSLPREFWPSKWLDKEGELIDD